MKIKRWKKVLMGIFVSLSLAVGVLVFAEEILAAKKTVFAFVTNIKQQTADNMPHPMEVKFSDYSPMEHSGEEWYQNTRLIYHAAGVVDGFFYTNSREAMYNTLDNGGTIVEIDFLFTSDGHLICGHTWEDLYALEPVSLEQVLYTGIYRKYTPMTAQDLVAIMEENPQLIIITDTKEENPVAVVEELIRLCDGDEQLMHRFVIQLYDCGMKEEVMKIHPFPEENFLFTVYKFGKDRMEEVFQLCYDEQIKVVTVPNCAWPGAVTQLFREKGIFVFEHTVNDPADVRDAIARDVQGVYTDILWLEDLDLKE